ncbi:MAG: LysR family transcriptional regulator [Geminicoccaceae bacterium]
MELRNIDYFLTVAEEGSLRGAARKLGLTQPALTKAVRRLEDETGVSLFDRRSRGVELTVYGQSFRRHARMFRASMVEAQSELDALRQGTAGLVRLGAGPSFMARIVPDVLRRFRGDHPRVKLQIAGGLDDALKERLRSGSLDLVVAALPPEGAELDLVRIPLMTDEYHVIADRAHPLRCRRQVQLADLLDYPWILPSPSTHLVSRLGVLFATAGLPAPQPMIETDIVATKLQLMDQSDYLSFHAVAHLKAQNVARIAPLAIEGAFWARRAGVMTRRGLEPNPAARALIDMIGAHCRELVAEPNGWSEAAAG